MIKLARKIKKQRIKIAKVKCNIHLLLYCKKNNLATIFTRPKFAITVNNYLQNKISRQMLETKIRNRHPKKKIELGSWKRTLTILVKKLFSFVKLFSTAKSKIQCRKKNVDRIKFTTTNSISYILKEIYILKNIINNSSYTLKSEDEYALSLSLD